MEGATAQKSKQYIRWWFWSGAGLIVVMLIVGGITRLTGSGLSMTDWNLIMGALPPFSESAWQEIFSRYKQFPEYQQLNVGMTLGEFKAIFFWEYTHRLLGRIVGLAFLLPFIWFLIRGYFTRRLIKRSLFLFVLGAAQGLTGWVMVKSGLIDVPRVSHYRLMMHLSIAFALVGFCAWFALDLAPKRSMVLTPYKKYLFPLSVVIGILLGLQMLWGALVAGLDAGFIYNTFPLMNGSWWPRNFVTLQPALLNFVENPGTVQWVHRLLATLLLVGIAVIWIQTERQQDRVLVRRARMLLGLILVQYVLGIGTLLMQVPVAMGVIHQAVAMVVWLSWIALMHRLYRMNKGRKKVLL